MPLGGASATAFPSTRTSSPGAARSPSFATRPRTETRPAAIQDSISRREPSPAAASSFWSRSAVGAGGGFFRAGFWISGFRLGRPDLGIRHGLRLEGERLRDLLERRQLLQRAQAELVQELAGGGIERRPARGLAMPHDVDPAVVLERLDDLGGDRDAADVLDVAPRDRLAVGNDGEGLHDGTRVARRFFGEQPLDVRLEIGPGLEAPAARHRHQLDRAPAPFFAQLVEELADRVDANLLIEQALQLERRERLLRGEQPRLEDALQVSGTLHGPILRKSARNSRTA